MSVVSMGGDNSLGLAGGRTLCRGGYLLLVYEEVSQIEAHVTLEGHVKSRLLAGPFVIPQN